ncbi:VOC family protein [Intrasporangium sp.]|uniref:VOC family protein n=1 Tax=Intrasporangium sp. TaxID=1925024 RepID=UPI003365913B
MSTLDHLVVAADDLERGAQWVADRLGVGLDAGGRHAAFGTHNRLLSLGPDSYLEVIAVDPDALAPDRPRWFELDTAAMRERVADGPALVHWVVRVDSVDEIADPLELSRGDNRWVIGVPPDGRMPLSGLAPSRILWRTPPPSTLLPDKGVRLRQLVLSTDEPVLVRDALGGVRGPVVVTEGALGLSATLDTPTGPVEVGHLQ